MRPYTLLAIASLAAGAFAVPASAAVIISPVSATASESFYTDSINRTINEEGLYTVFVSGVTDFDTYVATNPLHDFVNAYGEWFSLMDPTSVQVTTTFGGVISIDRLAVWNEDGSGMGTAQISVSDDGISFSFLTRLPR